MNNPKISLIIPVYNGSDYIEECLDSAISQTLKEIEIICVNDGSTDNSLEILEKYASKDKRIKIVSKKNEGQGYARKVGLDSASGKYILFCDQDDKFASIDSFQIAFDRIEKYNTDIAIFSFSYWDEENKRDIILSKKKTVFRVFEEKDLILGYVAPWLKIYRKSFLDSYDDWYFPKFAFIEDPPFHVQILLRANSITTIDKVLYLHRTTNPNSITLRKKFDIRHAEAVSVFCEKIKNVLLKENVLEEYLSYFINFTFITSYNYIDKSDYDKQFIQRIKLLLNKNIDVAKHFFGIKNNFDKDRTLLFYFDNCRNVENDVVLLSIISELTKKYNIILVTNDEKQYILPSKINHVEINLLKEKLNLLKENKIVELLVLMCLTFSSDVFISLPNLGNDIFRYDIMKKFDIKTICCNQNNNQEIREIQNLRTQNNIQEQIIKRLQNSWSYRIGRVLTYPLSIPLEFYKYIRDYNLVKKSDLFDSNYYLSNNEDVKKAKMNPIKHYLKFGWKEGRNPSAKFNTNDYLNKRPDVRVVGMCPLVHYLRFGKDGK